VTARIGVSRLARVAVLVGSAVLAAACGPGGPADDASDRAVTELAQGLARTHERALTERAADPTADDRAAADRLGYAITRGNATSVVSATATRDGLEVVTAVGVRAEVGGGMFAEQATLGACLRTQATSGSLTGDVGERGTVSTEAVPCPDGVVPVVESRPVDAGARDQALVDFARRLTLAPREAPEAVAELRTHLSVAEVYDAIAVVGLLNFANRAALATGISDSDDLP
jgi:hypothetical protein